MVTSVLLSLFRFIFIIFNLCVCVRVPACTTYIQRETGYPGAEVSGSCELAAVGTGN